MKDFLIFFGFLSVSTIAIICGIKFCPGVWSYIIDAAATLLIVTGYVITADPEKQKRLQENKQKELTKEDNSNVNDNLLYLSKSKENNKENSVKTKVKTNDDVENLENNQDNSLSL